MSLAETIANALGGAKKTPQGFVCKCPCHDDRAASLSLKVTSSGGIMLNCFAGCKWEDVKEELIRRGLIQKYKNNTPYKTSNKYDGAKFYTYKDLVGNILCRKVKLPNKSMWFERLEGSQYISGLQGMIVPLYNLQNVIAADLVYLCEGEKDAETLINLGFCATTNHAGAKSWAPHLTDQLKGKTVIIIPDNDDAGRKRVKIISRALQSTVKELRVFIPDNVPEHGDITDWVNSGGDASTILSKSVVVEKKAEAKKATREEYFQLFEQVLNNPRRCIFNDKLMHLNGAGNIWNPCVNSLDIIKSEALTLNETRESKFNTSSIQPHFFAFEDSKPLEFLVDIPEWDGEDRIGAMAYLMKLKENAGIDETAFSELLKEWCSLMFQRLHDPMIQNRILVLQGGQGIGKDTWISMLVDGLGQFSIPFAVIKEDKDTFLNLHRGLVMKISEFDKTSKTEVSTLKDIITAPCTNIRAPYDKDSKLRYSRGSFISSANIENILRDPTGNRRFLIFEIKSIEYAYEGWSTEKIKHWQMQCLAEMVRLAEMKYTASIESWRQMREYIEIKTPSEYSLDIMEQFTSDFRSDLTVSNGEIEISPTNQKVRELVSELAKQNRTSYGNVKRMLQDRIGVHKRIGDKRIWVWRIPKLEEH